MRNLIDKIISVLKREKFELDKNIPLNYLISLFSGKAVELLYGFLIFRKPTKVFVHPTSKIKCKKQIIYGRNLSIARGCYIDALSKEGITFGNNVSVGKHTCIECTGNIQTLGKGLKVGNNVGLGTHGFWGCAGGIEIGSNTIIGNFVSFHSENHNFSDLKKPIRLQGVTHKGIIIGENCWIGAKATILDGAVIGDGSIIAAGAVVNGEYPANCIIGGVPSRIIKYRN